MKLKQATCLLIQKIGAGIGGLFTLPQLIRKTVTKAEDMVPTTYHHTIYEIEGDIQELAAVENSELLDKKSCKKKY